MIVRNSTPCTAFNHPSERLRTISTRIPVGSFASMLLMTTNPVGANQERVFSVSSMLTFSRRIATGISLEILKEEDAGALFAVVDANRAYLRRWMPWLDGNRSSADTLAFIQSTRKMASDNLGFSVAIRVDEEIAGITGYHTINWPNRSSIMGYWIAEPHQGRGIMTRSCRALIDFAFAALNINRVAIACATENGRSRAIPERLGFQREGISRAAEWLYTHYVDHAIYSLLQREWQAEIIANPQCLMPSDPRISEL
jgi:ribosomal-protein-serine acetyltransferase